MAVTRCDWFLCRVVGPVVEHGRPDDQVLQRGIAPASLSTMDPQVQDLVLMAGSSVMWAIGRPLELTSSTAQSHRMADA